MSRPLKIGLVVALLIAVVTVLLWLTRPAPQPKPKPLPAAQPQATLQAPAPTAPLLHRLGAKPKLCIIIDDISSPGHIKTFLATGLKLTPSLIPNGFSDRQIELFVKPLPFYMIHLPLQYSATQRARREDFLWADDPQVVVDAKIDELVRRFPDWRYLNNHMGSHFTSTPAAMERLLSAIARNGRYFVDSYTTASSVTRTLTAKYNLPYIQRDIFLDHLNTPEEVRKQLVKAVRLAKKRGWAIAIGHPYGGVTYRVLKEQKALLDEVELVYPDNL